MESKVVVITGASGGIGAAVAMSCAELGHKVVLVARRKKELEKVAQSLESPSLVCVADVTLKAELQGVLEQTLAAFGGIDVWVNNAGRGISKRVLDLTAIDVEEMIRNNVLSALYGMQVVVPHFITKGRGHIINVSSMLAKISLSPSRSAYSAAKAALNSLSETLRLEYAESCPALRVSVVMPGLVATEFARNADSSGAPIPPPPGNIPPPQTAEEVGKQIADLIENPMPELIISEILRRKLRALRESGKLL